MGKPNGKRPVGRPRTRLAYYIEYICEETAWNFNKRNDGGDGIPWSMAASSWSPAILTEKRTIKNDVDILNAWVILCVIYKDETTVQSQQSNNCKAIEYAVITGQYLTKRSLLDRKVFGSNFGPVKSNKVLSTISADSTFFWKKLHYLSVMRRRWARQCDTSFGLLQQVFWRLDIFAAWKRNSKIYCRWIKFWD